MFWTCKYLELIRLKIDLIGDNSDVKYSKVHMEALRKMLDERWTMLSEARKYLNQIRQRNNFGKWIDQPLDINTISPDAGALMESLSQDRVTADNMFKVIFQ
jgi:hypothetical protein